MTTILEKTAGLVAFVRTVDTGSFAAAAKAIGASPSAVSKSVARLEQRLGARLLQRTTRALSLTAEGAAYYDRISPHLKAIEEADELLQAPQNVRGLLRVTAPTTFGRALIAAWAESFLKKYPDIRLELSITDRHVDLVRESFDIAIRIGEAQEATLVGRCLGELHYVLAASPAYIAQRGDPKSIGDLKDHACLRYLQGGRPQPFTFADNTRYYPDGLFDTDDAQYLIEASVRGAGIAQFMKLNIENDIATGRLQVVLPQLPMFTTPVYVLHPYAQQPPLRVRLFTDFLVESIGELL